MTARRKSGTVALLLVALLALSGCEGREPINWAPEEDLSPAEQTLKTAKKEEGHTGLYEKHKLLQDGRTITCITYEKPGFGGLTCDWEGAEIR